MIIIYTQKSCRQACFAVVVPAVTNLNGFLFLTCPSEKSIIYTPYAHEDAGKFTMISRFDACEFQPKFHKKKNENVKHLYRKPSQYEFEVIARFRQTVYFT